MRTRPLLPHPILRQPNARFWVFINDAWVKVTLRCGQTLTWGKSRPDEEGYSFETSTWCHEGPIVIDEWSNGGSDCDGPISRSGTSYCPIADLAGVEAMGEDMRDYFDGRIIHRPEWRQAGSTRVHDARAQAAGY